MIKFNESKNKNLDYLIFFLTIVIFIASIVRDIDLNGDNSDDKLTLYVYAVSQNLDEQSKNNIISNVKDDASQKCSLKYACVNRLEMQINQNNNYPIISFLINSFDKILKNDDGDLIKISKSIHYGLLTSQILFFSIFLIVAFNTINTTKVALIVFLFFIIIIDKKILNINLLGFFPYWNSITVSATEYMPRGIALFSGILSFVFFYLRKFRESILFLGISFLYHSIFGLILLFLIVSFFIFDLIIQYSKYSKKKINIIFFSILSIFTLLFNKLGFFLIIIPCYFICTNTKNFRNNNLIISILISILLLLFIFTFENLINKIVVMEQHYIYLSSIINFFNSEYLLRLFSYENIKDINDSYFMYYLRHAPSRVYPLLLPSLAIILIIENLSSINRIFNNIKKKYFSRTKSFSFILVIIMFSWSPVVLDRLVYLGYAYKNIPNDLIIGMKKEETYLFLEKISDFTLDEEYLDLMDFKKRENLSFYLLSQLYKKKQ
jgi:hypothetical protein